MEFTQDQRNTKFTQASDTQRYLYSDPDSGEAILNIAQTNHITPGSQYKSFAIAVGDVILGLVPQEKLPGLLVERLNIAQAEAFRITADVLDFLAPLDQAEGMTAVQSDSTPVPINEAISIKDNSLANEIAEAEAAIQTLEPIKTMSHDMEVKRETPVTEPTHTAATQSDLLDRSATIKDKNPDARWDTE